MAHQYHLTRISGNRKLGGLPASTTSSDSCPDACSYRNGEGCYGDGGPVALHWRAVSERRRGVPLGDFVAQVRQLPKYQLWRHNQVGDLPGDGKRIDIDDDTRRLGAREAGAQSVREIQDESFISFNELVA